MESAESLRDSANTEGDLAVRGPISSSAEEGIDKSVEDTTTAATGEELRLLLLLKACCIAVAEARRTLLLDAAEGLSRGSLLWRWS